MAPNHFAPRTSSSKQASAMGDSMVSESNSAVSTASISLRILPDEEKTSEQLLDCDATATALLSSVEPAIAACAPSIDVLSPPRKASSRKPIVLLDATGRERTYGSALGALTRKFVDIVQASPTGTVDMNETAMFLQVPKRRIYDITNVLEGVGILEKRSKNTVAWKGSEALLGPFLDPDVKEQLDSLRSEIASYLDEEALIDQMITQLTKNTTNPSNVTCSDITDAVFYPEGLTACRKDELVDQTGRPLRTLMVIHAPHGSLVQMPAPEYEGQMECQLFVSTKDTDSKFSGDMIASGKKRKLSYEGRMRSSKSARADNQIQVYLLSTSFEEARQKIVFTDLKVLSNDEKERSSSWDLAESLANDGVSDFIVASEEEAV